MAQSSPRLSILYICLHATGICAVITVYCLWADVVLEKGHLRVSMVMCFRFQCCNTCSYWSVNHCVLCVQALKKVGGMPPLKPHVDCITTHQTVRLPGLIDVHVHAREPGGEHKETFTTCTRAALAGGVTTVLCMPNTNPAITSLKHFKLASKVSDVTVCIFTHFFFFLLSHIVLWSSLLSAKFDSFFATMRPNLCRLQAHFMLLWTCAPHQRLYYSVCLC